MDECGIGGGCEALEGSVYAAETGSICIQAMGKDGDGKDTDGKT